MAKIENQTLDNFKIEIEKKTSIIQRKVFNQIVQYCNIQDFEGTVKELITHFMRVNNLKINELDDEFGQYSGWDFAEHLINMEIIEFWELDTYDETDKFIDTIIGLYDYKFYLLDDLILQPVHSRKAMNINNL